VGSALELGRNVLLRGGAPADNADMTRAIRGPSPAASAQGHAMVMVVPVLSPSLS